MRPIGYRLTGDSFRVDTNSGNSVLSEHDRIYRHVAS